MYGLDKMLTEKGIRKAAEEMGAELVSAFPPCMFVIDAIVGMELP